MDISNTRPYIPAQLHLVQLHPDDAAVSKSRSVRPPQSYSRDKHNKQRAAIHRLSKRKEQALFIYQNKPLFVLDLLQYDILMINNDFKVKLNKLLEDYETAILSIQECSSEKELDKVCASLNGMCIRIESVLSKDNFIHYVDLGYFINQDNINIKNDPHYKPLLDSIIDHNNEKEIHTKRTDNKLKENISFAEMLKRNISTHHITND